MNKNTSILLVMAAFLAACTQGDSPQAVTELPIRYAGIDLAEIGSAAALTGRCETEEGRFRDHLATLEAYDGAPTIAGYYQSLDSLYSSLATLSSTAQSLAGVHPDKELRDAGEACSQLLAKVGTDMSLSRPLYDAVSQLDVADADAQTRHSVQSSGSRTGQKDRK